MRNSSPPCAGQVDPMENCVFCAIGERRMPARIVLETLDLVCILPREPEVPGHTLIASRVHYHDLMDAPTALGQELFATAQALASRFREALGATGFNLLHATGAAAGQSVPHLHFHFLPRLAGDGVRLMPRLPGSTVDLDGLLRWAGGEEPAPGQSSARR